MDIYKRKQLWKLLLFFTALSIFGISLVYSNYIVRQIAQSEREKARLWAEAIRERALLVEYTAELFEKLKNEERKKVELWAKGFKQLITISDPKLVGFFFEVVEHNETVPVILTDEKGKVISTRNLDKQITIDSICLANELSEMKALYKPIEIDILGTKKNYLYYKDSNILLELIKTMDNIIESFISEAVINSASVPVVVTDSSETKILSFGNIESEKEGDVLLFLERIRGSDNRIELNFPNGNKNVIYYEESFLIKQLKYYPFVQFVVVGVFLIVAYLLFSMSRKAEQNQVWVGMSKETAHQLGTPVSSLMAWQELLKSTYPDDPILQEMGGDIKRLETIADRFSKIGSAPKLEDVNVVEVLEESVAYLRKRIPKSVDFQLNAQFDVLEAKMSTPLFAWVIENLIRNAVDAMEGKGRLLVNVFSEEDKIVILITDTGKGISKNRFKTIFQPGFTTKKRGWGLGLTLVKRIVENYHFGRIFVLSSEPNVETIFRIELNRI